jgi:TolB-like protein/DNA-binding winged helix-turn-helix (wHTH) protein
MGHAGAAYEFGPFRLDPATRVVTRNGVAVSLNARALGVLLLLAEREGRVVSRDDILASVWRGVTVEENNLTVQISGLRKALGEMPDGTPAIVTVPNQGYRLAGPVLCRVAPAEDTLPANPLPRPDGKAEPARIGRRWPLMVAGGVLALAIVAGGFVLLGYRDDAAIDVTGRAASFTPTRLSIVILPFRNLANDHQDDPLADAVSDDLTTEMAHMPASTVIARETADSYKGRAVPTGDIARALNVRYVLEGSLRGIAGRISVNAQLIEALSGHHLWAERFDVPRTPAGDVQPTIVYRIASVLRTVLIADEAKRSLRERPTNPDAMDLYMQARELWDREESRASMAQAVPLLEHAVRLDPDYVPALAELGAEFSADIDNQGPSGMADRVARGHVYVDHALGLARNDPYVLAAQGFLLMNDGNFSQANASFQASLAIDPGNRRALTGSWIAAKCLAHWQDARDQVLRLKWIDPEGPGANFRDEQIGEFDLFLGHYAQAAEEIERGDASWPAPKPGVPAWDALGSDRLFLAAALVLSGDVAKGRALLKEDERDFPHRSLFRLGTYMSRTAQHDPGMQRVFAALRQAGVPDYTDDNDDENIPPPAMPERHGDLDPTPAAVPGIPTIDTPALIALRRTKLPPVLIDMGSGVARPPGALEGNFNPLSVESTRKWLQANAAKLTGGAPIVVFADSAFGWRAYNGILQLRAAGVTGLMWYRGGEEAWAKARQPAEDTRTL